MGYFIRASVNGEDNSHYFGTLDQFYILGSIFNYLRNVSQSAGNDFRDYFYLDSGVTNAWAEMQLDFKNRLIDNEDWKVMP